VNRLWVTLLTATSVAAISWNATAVEKMGQTKSEYNAVKARADADYNAARVRCKAISGNDRDVCVQQAKAARSKARADAKANFEGTGEAKLEAREEMIEADYKVAKEKCDSLAGDAKDVCVAEAKATHAKEKATLEANEKSMAADYKLAKERCSTLSGPARRSCLKEAKIKFDD
jgi:hypothetical protein